MEYCKPLHTEAADLCTQKALCALQRRPAHGRLLGIVTLGSTSPLRGVTSDRNKSPDQAGSVCDSYQFTSSENHREIGHKLPTAR